MKAAGRAVPQWAGRRITDVTKRMDASAMKVAILAGGRGKRLLQQTRRRPKPLIEIGGHPILWHVMKHYDFYGHRDFVIALGYRGDRIKRQMADLCALAGDLTVHAGAGRISRRGSGGPDWTVDLIETGLDTATGGRIKRLRPALGDQTFMLTYSDVLSDVNLDDLAAYHRSHGKLVTLTAVQPPCRFGRLKLDGERVSSFVEKPRHSQDWVSGGFFVLEPGALDYIQGDATSWEGESLERLARDGELMAFRHKGFWQCMDTPYDREVLEELWQRGKAPWKVWE